MKMEWKNHAPALVAGLNRSKKLILAGGAAKVYLASDADDTLSFEMRALCEIHDVILDTSMTKKQLGRLCEITVGCAVCTMPRMN